MKQIEKDHLIKDLVILVGLLVCVRLLFLRFLPQEAVSDDFHAWLQVSKYLLAGENPYNMTWRLNYPPFWMQILYGLAKFSIATDISTVNCIRFFLIGSEAVLIAILFFALRMLRSGKGAFWLVLLGISLNPICILQVCQHGNFDVMVGLWILLALLMLILFQQKKDQNHWLLACLFLGLGILTKTVPLCLMPLLLIAHERLPIKAKALGAVLLLGPVLLGMSIIYVLGPEYIPAKVILYRSIAGYFGITGLLHIATLDHQILFYGDIFTILYIGLLLLVVWLIWNRGIADHNELVLTACGLLLMLLLFGPGYSPQYIYWLIPLLILAYSMGSKKFKTSLIILYCTASTTYVFEYAFFLSHGSFLFHMFPTKEIAHLAAKVSTMENQTLIRLPLFVAYCIVFSQIPFHLKRMRDLDGGRL